MTTSREQQLVDLCFALVIVAQECTFTDNEGAAKWVAEQLRQNGFPTTPRGSSWGVLEEDLPDGVHPNSPYAMTRKFGD